MPSCTFRPIAWLGLSASLSAFLLLSGCESLLDKRYGESVAPTEGTARIQGIGERADVRRNAMGMPLIEAPNFHDALFALGYVHASDRLSQMIGMRALAQGRLAETAGPGVLDIDRFMRTVNLRSSAEVMYRNASPRLKQFFEVYARGVNAYIFQYRNKLPMDLAQSGQKIEYWEPEDSALVFALINFGLATNLREELASLTLAQKVGADKLAWLMPTYPDEQLPFDEADKLKNLNLTGNLAGVDALTETLASVADLHMSGVAASNSWAIKPSNARSGKSLFANDMHLPLAMPSLWNFVQIRSPKYQAAGVSVAGIPAIVAGYNGHLAWGMTMVMGDNQDIFLEQVKRENGRTLYLADGKWIAARERQETYLVKGQRPIQEKVYETRNGPLLNAALGERKQGVQPLPASSGYGLALRSIQNEADQTLDALFDLSRAKSVDQAFDSAREVRSIALNLMFADAGHVGWQVSGRYPNRRDGRGLIPSPGWTDRYSWDGYADPMLHPYDLDPPQGWLATANQRTVKGGYGVQLSNSWYYPERAERIAELAGRSKQDTRSTVAMQYDQTTLFAKKLKAMLEDPAMASSLRRSIDALPAPQRVKADEALKRLLAFDGQMAASSADAAIYSAFLQESAKQTFLDELRPEDGPTWKAFVEMADISYSAQADHLLGREDSPFWNDTRTPREEDKPTILARSLAACIEYLEANLGADRKAWQWGKLHQYRWTTETTRLAPYLDAGQRASVNAIQGYLDRGPYQAGGDHSTLNTSAYHWGQGFDTWLVPSMRMIVDFGLAEPMMGLNSTGQSGNPASPHYDDGIQNWMKGQYMSFPFQPAAMDKVYGTRRLTLLPGAGK
ncbi:penicillin acylase family protein [Pseudomonas matsuisoli]|uniref:Acyl-homoserine lactone acylase QuiP n=1 Tax=Pseudomonas matsuisoli TaxID=1515666 RepID=A0A917URJ6_9PSED|nr:penicillin acylase family protein [Pseudomonas matsuisoli]GGJ79341.1 acyl-homoserine lactone acylase QuiP [Pseudomonas matsuisoli]